MNKEKIKPIITRPVTIANDKSTPAATLCLCNISWFELAEEPGLSILHQYS